MTLNSIVVERPEAGIQHLCLDKGYDNPTGHEAVAAHGYQGHIRRIGEEKLDSQGERSYPARRWVGGAHLGLTVQVPGDTGALRQESSQLHRSNPIGLRPALVPPPTQTQVLR